MSRLVGVVPAAGRGTRAYPYTKGLPKGLLEVDGTPILERVLRLFREQLDIEDVVVVIGEHGELIRQRFGDGSRLGLRLRYVQNDAIEKGLSHSVMLAEPWVEERFVVILSDECYFDSTHRDLRAFADRDALAVCAVRRPDHPDQVRRNYAVHAEGGTVQRLEEKPAEPDEALLGLGTILFRREIFSHLRQALARPEAGPTGLLHVLARACDGGASVLACEIGGAYVNVNDRDELNYANNLSRTRRFSSLRLSLALLAQPGCHGLPRAVEEFRRTGRFHQIVVVAPPGEELPAGIEGVTALRAPSRGLGDRLRAGLDACDGDLLFSAWGDGSFAPGDVPKFLEYLKEGDLVVGTRTTRQLVHQGTHMRGAIWLANVALASILDVVWWGYEPRFTDVGCIYRALWSSTYRWIRPRLAAHGPESAVEMVLETLRCRRRVLEIPVHFRLRGGEPHGADQRLRTALAILGTIVRRRISRPLVPPGERHESVAGVGAAK